MAATTATQPQTLSVETYSSASYSWRYENDIPVATLDTNGANSPYGNGEVVVGYYKDNAIGSEWCWAPNRDGNIPIHNAPKTTKWEAGPGRWSSFHTWEKYDYSFYPRGEDRRSRLYILTKANDGYVPVRVATDPSIGNWLSRASSVKIVYDAFRYKHPACDIDYSKHGFTLINGKVWWPIKNDGYSPTIYRTKTAYNPDVYDPDPAFPSQHSCVNTTILTVALLAGVMQDSATRFLGFIYYGSEYARSRANQEIANYEARRLYLNNARTQHNWLMSQLEAEDRQQTQQGNIL